MNLLSGTVSSESSTEFPPSLPERPLGCLREADSPRCCARPCARCSAYRRPCFESSFPCGHRVITATACPSRATRSCSAARAECACCGGAAVIPPLPLDARTVKARADFVAIVSSYTRLRRSGRQCVGLCPLHRERHPSFYVHPEQKVFYCFGCGAGGDLFAFLMRAESCDFLRALEIAASVPGVARESEPRSGERIRAGVGAKPLAPRSGALHITWKPEPSRHFNALRGNDPGLRLAAALPCERAALLLESEG